MFANKNIVGCISCTTWLFDVQNNLSKTAKDIIMVQ